MTTLSLPLRTPERAARAPVVQPAGDRRTARACALPVLVLGLLLSAAGYVGVAVATVLALAGLFG